MPDKGQLNLAADRIEMIFKSRNISARVTGGAVSSGGVTFNLVTPWGLKRREVCDLLYEVTQSLHAESCQIASMGSGQLQLEARGIQ